MDDRLTRTLAEARRTVQALQASPGLKPHAGGLAFARARQAARDPRALTDPERTHLSDCRHCANLIEHFGRLVPPSWAVLLAYAAGRLDAACARQLAARCAADPPLAAQVQSFKQLRDTALVRSAPPGAANGELPEVVTIRSANGRLQGTLAAEGADQDRRWVLQVRARDAAFDQQLLGCAFGSGGGRTPLLRLAVLHRDGDNGYAARVRLSADEARQHLGSAPESFEVVPLEAAQLSAEDVPALKDSLRLAEPADRPAWRNWLGQAGPTFRALLTDCQQFPGSTRR